MTEKTIPNPNPAPSLTAESARQRSHFLPSSPSDAILTDPSSAPQYRRDGRDRPDGTGRVGAAAPSPFPGGGGGPVPPLPRPRGSRPRVGPPVPAGRGAPPSAVPTPAPRSRGCAGTGRASHRHRTATAPPPHRTADPPAAAGEAGTVPGGSWHGAGAEPPFAGDKGRLKAAAARGCWGGGPGSARGSARGRTRVSVHGRACTCPRPGAPRAARGAARRKRPRPPHGSAARGRGRTRAAAPRLQFPARTALSDGRRPLQRWRRRRSPRPLARTGCLRHGGRKRVRLECVPPRRGFGLRQRHHRRARAARADEQSVAARQDGRRRAR